MKKIAFVLILCFVFFLLSFTNKEETIQASNDNSNIVKSLAQTTDYLKLQINSPMKLAEYTAYKNDKSNLLKSVSKDVIFIPNKGQIADTEGKLRPDILYKAELGGVDLYLTKKGMSFVFYKYKDNPNNFAAGKKEVDRTHNPFKDDIEDKIVKMYRMDLDIVGMNPNFKTVNEEQTTEYFNYYYAHCPDGIINVYGYRKVILENVYNNIDLIFHSNEKGLKYDFVVKPGGYVSDIKLKYQNENNAYITEERKIKATNPFGELETNVLYTYQSDGKVIKSDYLKEPDGTIRINTEEYNKTKELILDPYLVATYYGGNGWDEGWSINTDNSNNIFVTGLTMSTNFPLYNPGGGAYFQDTLEGNYSNAYILKFNSNGVRQWATYYGGSRTDKGYSIISDGNNNVLVTGYTWSTNFPLYNPGGGAYFQDTIIGNEYDTFILKFSPNGTRQWATYYGGSADDRGYSITTDNNNNIFISGTTESTNFPLLNPGAGAYFQDSVVGDFDIFILKFNSNGVRQWATYYGGIALDYGFSIDTDILNNIIVIGNTESTNFPLYNPGGGAYFQDTNAGNGYGTFILKFTSNGIRQWATYYGGSSYDYSYSVTTDVNNNILITGSTFSVDFPLQNPGGASYFQSTILGIQDIFILKFSSNGIRQWATYYGGNLAEYGGSIFSSNNNNILITGKTRSLDFPVQNPGGYVYFQSTHSGGTDDAYVLKFNSTGVRQWATYYGGNGEDDGKSITADNNNNILISGYTESMNFPLKNPGTGAYFQNTLFGLRDAFILGFDSSGVITDIQHMSAKIPKDFKLHQNFPNPFNPVTNIKFDLSKNGFVTLKVFNILGKEMTTLVNEKLSAGSYETEWDGSNYPSGVYFYRLVTDDFKQIKKMILVK